MSYRAHFVARFRDADPAGIVYFANYLDFCHRALESFFEEALHMPYADFIATGLGVPIVHVEGDFLRSIRFGESFWVEVLPLRVGNSSLQMQYTLQRASADQPSAVIRLTHVVTELAIMKPVPIPEAMRQALTASARPAPLP